MTTMMFLLGFGRAEEKKRKGNSPPSSRGALAFYATHVVMRRREYKQSNSMGPGSFTAARFDLLGAKGPLENALFSLLLQ